MHNTSRLAALFIGTVFSASVAYRDPVKIV